MQNHQSRALATPAGFNRNARPTSIGIGGRHRFGTPGRLHRNPQAKCSEGTVRYHVTGLGGMLIDAVLDDGSLDPDRVKAFSESVAFNRVYFGKDVIRR